MAKTPIDHCCRPRPLRCLRHPCAPFACLHRRTIAWHSPTAGREAVSKNRQENSGKPGYNLALMEPKRFPPWASGSRPTGKSPAEKITSGKMFMQHTWLPCFLPGKWMIVGLLLTSGLVVREGRGSGEWAWGGFRPSLSPSEWGGCWRSAVSFVAMQASYLAELGVFFFLDRPLQNGELELLHSTSWKRGAGLIGSLLAVTHAHLHLIHRAEACGMDKTGLIVLWNWETYGCSEKIQDKYWSHRGFYVVPILLFHNLLLSKRAFKLT